MPTPIKISQLPEFSGDASGSYVVINDSTNTTTYTVKKESLMSGSFSGTASYAMFAETASYIGTASWAYNSVTASSADDFVVRGSLTGSDALFTGTITAQTLYVQYITASTELVTGSTQFGTQLTDTHQFTGSVSVTGSFTVDGTLNATSSWAYNSVTASFVTSSNVYGPYGLDSVLTASYAATTSPIEQNLALDSIAPSSQLGRANNSFYYKTKADVVGQGQITLTNGSSTITGIGTNFLDSTYTGLSYWYSLELVDSAQNFYRIQILSIANDTSATIYEVFTLTDIQNGYYTLTARTNTWPGVSGTYNFWMVRNTSYGPWSFSTGNRAYSSDYGLSFGGSTVAMGGGTAIGYGTNAYGNGSFSAGIYSIATASSAYLGTANVAIGYHSLANGIGSFAGGGYFGTSYASRVRFITNLRRLTSSGTGSFNFSGNDTTQTSGHGALANYSAILGGINHNIPSTSPRSAIIGGNAIKADASRADTVYVPNLQVTGSIFVRGNASVTGSLFATSSWATNALTASSADSVFVRQNVTASNARFTSLFVTSSAPSTVAVTITGSVLMTGSITVSNMLVLVSQSALPITAPTGAIMTSGSGGDNKPYYWNGATWTPLF